MLRPELQAIADDFRAASDRLRRLVQSAPPEAWSRRVDPDRWSVAECVAHLNLTSEAFIPKLESALEEARRLDGKASAHYRRDPIGWLLWRTMGPPVRMRLRTTAAFVPEAAASQAELTSRFEELQEVQLRLVEASNDLPIDRVRIASPFDARARYNVYAALSILPRHQHRHLWQAEQLLGGS